MSKTPLYNFLHQWMSILVWLLFFFPFLIVAQNSFDLSGQLIQRAEMRNGYGRLFAEDQDTSFCIGERRRTNAAYNYEGIKLYVSAQDIRIWDCASNLKLSETPYLVTKLISKQGLSITGGFTNLIINDAPSFQFGYSQFLFSCGLKII